jgi:hypothetical protein
MQYQLERRIAGPVAVVAIGLAVVLAAVGTWGDDGGQEQGTQEFLIVCAVIALAGAAVFGWLVPRALDRGRLGATALTLSVLGALSIAVFWSGLPPILAAGGALLGWAGRNATDGAGLCRAAMVVGILALLADLAVYVGDSL